MTLSKSILITLLTCVSASLFAQSLLSRGPYLQLGTSTSVVIKWKTSTATSTKVSYGLTFKDYSNSVSSSEETFDHEVKLTNLQPNTKYFYALGDDQEIFQGTKLNYFKTYPVPSTDQKFRFWITGDCGNNSDNQRTVRDQYLKYVGSGHTDGWLLLGDNAYSNGLEIEYDENFFAQYSGSILKNTILWPSPGNHDYANNSTLQRTKNIPYYALFTLPTKAEAGGVASGTESYYSYEIGNIHFISLDSYGIEDESSRLYDTLGAQVTWLKQDLAKNTKMWTVAYWHHPPHTMGSHNSDTEDELVQIRTKLNVILERSQVDLVLCGHSHSYERSKLIKGHYGQSSTFNNSFVLDPSSANYDGSSNSCPYLKSSKGKGQGVIYIVAGSAGQVGGKSSVLDHPAMHYTNTTVGGSLIMEVEQNRLDIKWLAADGNIKDAFAIVKDAGIARSITMTEADEMELTGSWPGEYVWNRHHEKSRTITVAPRHDTSYVVTDKYSCLTDSFKITIDKVTEVRLEAGHPTVSAFPNPARGLVTIQLPYAGRFSVDLRDDLGRVVASSLSDSHSDTAALRLDKLILRPGTYLITVSDERTRWVRRVVIE